VREYDDAQLELVIRHGIKPSGRSVVEFMPSEMFSHLSDEDLGAIIAFLRSLPAANGPTGGIRFKPLARTFIALGKMGFAAPGLNEPVAHPTPDRSDPIAFGRYLALTSCTECHGSDLTGGGGMLAAPDLRIAGAYSLERFTRLMREGVPLDGRELGMMGNVSTKRFSHFTDGEIRALHAYLRARAQQ
jgi:mono/diheme cytochrome c family protein